VVRMSSKMMTHNILVETFDTNDDCQTLSSWEYFFSAGLRDQVAYATDCSEPSSH